MTASAGTLFASPTAASSMAPNRTWYLVASNKKYSCFCCQSHYHPWGGLSAEKSCEPRWKTRSREQDQGERVEAFGQMDTHVYRPRGREEHRRERGQERRREPRGGAQSLERGRSPLGLHITHCPHSCSPNMHGLRCELPTWLGRAIHPALWPKPTFKNSDVCKSHSSLMFPSWHTAWGPARRAPHWEQPWPSRGTESGARPPVLFTHRAVNRRLAHWQQRG